MSGCTRREWFAGLFAGPLASWARIPSLEERLSAITDEIAASPEGVIAFARQFGLRWVELRAVPGGRQYYASMDPGELRQVARLLADHGLRVSFLNTNLLKTWLPGTETLRPEWQRPAEEKAYERRLEDLDRALEAAHILGVDKIRVFTFRRARQPEQVLPRVAEVLEEMAERAAQAKVKLLVENEGSCNVATSEELAALMKLLPSPWVGINWDPYNGVRYGERPFPDGYRVLPRERIGNVQMKGRSILPGPEQFDWPAIFRTMLQDGYEGCFGLETHIAQDRFALSSECMKILLAWARES